MAFLKSPVMRRVADRFEAALLTDAGLMISGEQGTGRELLARAIHRAASPGQPTTLSELLCEGTRRFQGERAFVTLDCTAIADIEAALFGCGHGSGTDPAGVETITSGSHLHRAIGGTLFIDHLHEMPLRHQTRLARVLRDGEVWIDRDGPAAAVVAVQIRVIATIEPRLDEHDDRVAAELRRRLSAPHIHVPALRERREDIPGLVRQQLREMREPTNLPPMRISKQALALLSALPWKGNLAEMSHVLRTIAVNVPADTIRQNHVLDHIRLDEIAVAPRSEGTLKEARERFEREYVAAVLERHEGRMADAADALGIQRTNLYRKVRQLAVDRRSRRRL